MIETHSGVHFIVIEVDNQMVIIQVQVGKNIIEDFLLNGGANVNIITENLGIELDLPKPRPTHNGISKYDQTFKNHQKFEDSHTWHIICSHIYYFAK